MEYVLVGGVAVGLHGFERATNDIDLFVRPTAENVANLRRLAFVLKFWSKLRPRIVPHGVFKYPVRTESL